MTEDPVTDPPDDDFASKVDIERSAQPLSRGEAFIILSTIARGIQSINTSLVQIRLDNDPKTLLEKTQATAEIVSYIGVLLDELVIKEGSVFGKELASD